LLDKLEDEYDKKESEKGEENEVVVALHESIEKIKRYYTLTGALVYTVATGKFIIIIMSNFYDI
jgi:hypothetical protein